MRYALLVATLATVQIEAQTLIATLDVGAFTRGSVVGTPTAIDTDHDPMTSEWLVRYRDHRYLIAHTYFTVVVQTTAEVLCVGEPFLRSEVPEEGVLQPNGALHVRRDDALAIYRLDTPVCNQ